MEAGKLSQAVYNWLTEHPKLVGYLEIGAVARDNQIELEAKRRVEQLAAVTNFLNLTLLAKPPKGVSLLGMPEIGDPPEAVAMARKARFLQVKLARETRALFDSHVQMCNDLVDLLSREENGKIVLDVQEEAFFEDMLKLTPSNAVVIGGAVERMAAECEKAISKRASGSKYKNRMKTIIKECREVYDSSINFFPRTKEQDAFDAWLMAPEMPLREDVDGFLASFAELERKEFTPSLIAVFRKLRKLMDVRVPVDVSILVLLFFRTVFGEAYARSPEYFFPFKTKGILTNAGRITCEELSPPEEFLEPFSPGDTVEAAFSRDACYSAAGRDISAAMFETNPIDILYHIHKALVNVQNGVSRNMSTGGQKELLPFETVFTLFLGSVLASDAVNFEDLVEFVVDFSPSGRLCPAFQYSQVTLTATLSHLETFMQGE